MHFATTFRTRGGFVALVALAVLALSGSPTLAQVGPPGIDHYLVYHTTPIPGNYPLILSDQFASQTTHVADPLEFFANPVSKNGEVIYDQNLHYTWWHLNPPRPFAKTIVASNQFGDQQLTLSDAEYLWNPALKNVPGPGLQGPPVANHYLAYRASGPFVPRTVTLQDQFGAYQATVVGPAWFCTPVQKTYQGETFPIVRDEAHLTCYLIQPLTPFQPRTITFLDEFQFGTTVVDQQVWLCVPTFKHDVTDAKDTTWGAVKSTYR